MDFFVYVKFVGNANKSIIFYSKICEPENNI